jgi:beta-lactam-binding protein with PASTA domain
MNKKQAEKYLKKKGKEVTEKEVDKVMKEGKIYGDPSASVQ